MDALMLQTTGGAGEEKVKRKKKTNKVVSVGEVNVAQLESLTPVKTAKKLKPLKPRTNKVAAKKTTRTHQSEDPGNPDAFENGSNAANAAPGTGIIDQITNSSTPSWWVPPCGVDNSAGVGQDHNIMLVTDIHEGRRDAIANRKKNQPQEGMSRTETHEGAGKPYSLCTPIFSARVPSLADMVFSQTLFSPLPLM
jgi:hypothetical protein